jgi:hypothetical protein
MFGSPSGPLHDATGALANGGTIVEGWLLARIDVRLPIEEPYGEDRRVGSVVAILTAANAESPLARVDRSTRPPAADWREIGITTVAKRLADPDAATS